MTGIKLFHQHKKTGSWYRFISQINNTDTSTWQVLYQCLESNELLVISKISWNNLFTPIFLDAQSMINDVNIRLSNVNSRGNKRLIKTNLARLKLALKDGQVPYPIKAPETLAWITKKANLRTDDIYQEMLKKQGLTVDEFYLCNKDLRRVETKEQKRGEGPELVNFEAKVFPITVE